MMTKLWQCTVCGYIHDGDEPPETCPVCGSSRALFVPLAEKKFVSLQVLLGTFKLHPVAAHFPGGLVPTAALLLLLSFVLGDACLDAAVFWLVMVASAVVPVSIGSGIYDWQTYFGGRRVRIFFKKIGLALSLLILGLVAITLRHGHPELLTGAGWQRWLFLFCILGMLGCVVLLGHYGAILVSMRPGEKPLTSGRSGDNLPDDWSHIILTQAADAILAADSTGGIRFWNQGAERIFGIPATTALGQSLNLIVPESLRQRHWEGWAKVMRSGESRYGTEMLRVPALRGDGSRFSAEFTIVMLKDDTGKVTGVAAILRDVSEQWEREKQLQAQLAACREQKP
jgi:PAS domain S-box-containing protein